MRKSNRLFRDRSRNPDRRPRNLSGIEKIWYDVFLSDSDSYSPNRY